MSKGAKLIPGNYGLTQIHKPSIAQRNLNSTGLKMLGFQKPWDQVELELKENSLGTSQHGVLSYFNIHTFLKGPWVLNTYI